MGKGRTHLYTIWKACERLHLLPPSVKYQWEENTPLMQAHLLAYDEGRNHEEIPSMLPMTGM